jgi:hypothetical protein
MKFLMDKGRPPLKSEWFCQQPGGFPASGGGGGGAVNSPVLGHRADAVMIDDVQPSYTTGTQAHKLGEKLCNNFFYGTTDTSYVKSASEAYNKRMAEQVCFLSEYTLSTKEKEMAVGGNACHLCGEEVLHESTNRLVKKKHDQHENIRTYSCGTQCIHTYRTNGTTSEVWKDSLHVAVGNACIDLGGV